MATFIPEWVKVSGRDVLIKRALNELDDTHVVRRALRGGSGAVDFFIQHRDNGWQALSIEEARFAEIDPAQLFASARQSQFERRLSELRALGSDFNPSGFPMESLVLLWNCTNEEVAALTKALFAVHGIRMVAKARFVELGAKLVGRGLAPIPREFEHRLFNTYFPEAEIPAACTLRRALHRDNGARLEPTFLDPQQEWASKLDLEMPAEQANVDGDFSVRLINGVAGSGKTLIAVNRALLLAELFPTQRLLLLIHNTPIVADLKERLHRAHGGLPANLELRTASSWTSAQWRAVFGRWPSMPKSPDRVPTLVKMLRLRPPLSELRGTDAQLIDELNFINDTLLIDEASFQTASRVGRGFALRATDRSQMWMLYLSVTATLARSGVRMWSSVPRELCLQKNGHQRLQKYHHILIDEAQFFVPSTLQLLKLSLTTNGQLFLCADPNQGFMKSRLSWKSAGIDVVGRTKKLRKSYRTTRAILEAATGVLAALGGVDSNDSDDYLEPDFDGMEAGTQPILLYVDSPQDAIERLTNELAAIYDTQNTPLAATLVIYGDNVPKRPLHERLNNYFDGHVWWFNEDAQKKLPPHGYGHDYLRMANVDTATGLEGAIVFLLGVEHLFLDALIPGITDDERTANLEERARKLYMAMTRAGQRLVVISSQRLPREMEWLFEIAA